MRLRNPFRRRSTPAQLAFDAQVSLLLDVMRQLSPKERLGRLKLGASYGVTAAQAMANLRAFGDACAEVFPKMARRWSTQPPASPSRPDPRP